MDHVQVAGSLRLLACHIISLSYDAVYIVMNVR